MNSLEPRPPTDDELLQCLEHFHALLGQPKTSEAEWQRLFSECPHIFVRTLPLRFDPRQIRPLGRRGRSEPDFVIYPEPTDVGSPRGIIELKPPQTRVLTFPRKGQVILSRAAATAVQQTHVYATTIDWPDRVVVLGDDVYKFVIMGLSRTWADKLQHEFIRDQLSGLFRGVRLFGYDQLFENFRRSIPQRLILLVPDVLPHSDKEAAPSEGIELTMSEARRALTYALKYGAGLADIDIVVGSDWAAVVRLCAALGIKTRNDLNRRLATVSVEQAADFCSVLNYRSLSGKITGSDLMLFFLVGLHPYGITVEELVRNHGWGQGAAELAFRASDKLAPL